MNYKNGKWAEQILALQREDGTWGRYFHTLSQPTKENPITTEQALRRLKVLGFTLEDEPIRRAVDCMAACLRGDRRIDDYYEKTHDWDFFTKFMLSAWIRIFDSNNETALSFARKMANIAEMAFVSGSHNRENHAKAFNEVFGRTPNKQSGWEIGFGMLYDAVLLQGLLTLETERKLFDFYLAKPDGLYYINSGQLNKLPKVFASRQTSRYLAGLEILAGYGVAKEKLVFAADWLNINKSKNGTWDLGQDAKDGIYFPLSDSWRKAELREADCTARIGTLFHKIRR